MRVVVDTCVIERIRQALNGPVDELLRLFEPRLRR
jgi:hypothetical protein